MRRFIAIQILLALGPAVFSAPLLHLHGHENTDHFVNAHRAQPLGSHTHFSTSACGRGHRGTVVGTASRNDDDAVFLNWFQDNRHPAPSVEFVFVETFVVPVPAPSASWSDVPTHRSHGPPLISCLTPRSPPTPQVSPLGA